MNGYESYMCTYFKQDSLGYLLTYLIFWSDCHWSAAQRQERKRRENKCLGAVVHWFACFASWYVSLLKCLLSHCDTMCNKLSDNDGLQEVKHSGSVHSYYIQFFPDNQVMWIKAKKIHIKTPL